jgi:3-dehydroquinate synthase
VFSFEVVFPAARQRATRVLVGRGILARLPEEIAESFPAHLAVVVSDDRVFPLHGEPVLRALRAVGLRAEPLVFPEGETSKTRETKSALEDGLLALGAGGDTLILAVGGGVTGDLAGFVASTWHRGIPVVQVPTSLLAMTDAALGGKTAVNLPGGKNLVGTFHQPFALWADLETLSTLPEREYRAGLAEAVKSAAIADAAGFRAMEDEAGALGAREPSAVERAVRVGLEVKARFVAEDEIEQGRRAALNFGHTVAHALEAVSSWTILHGEAVSIGLVAEARIAVRRLGFPAEQAERVRGLLSGLGLPTEPPRGLDRGLAIEAIRRDKKRRKGVVRVALPERLGTMPNRTDPCVEVPEEDVVGAVLGSD